jgi:hypothetical protein
MDFKWHDRSSSQKRLIPNDLIGLWERFGRKYEFRADGRYYVLDLDISYQLLDSGMTLVHSGTRYKRLYGDPVGLSGVWQLEADPLEEWNLSKIPVHGGTHPMGRKIGILGTACLLDGRQLRGQHTHLVRDGLVPGDALAHSILSLEFRKR